MNYCSSCGEKVQAGVKFCSNCGNSLVAIKDEPSKVETRDTSALASTIEKSEKTYYSDNNGVSVTKSRIIIGSATYTVANITSVKTAKRSNKHLSGLIFSIVGLIIIIFSEGTNYTIFSIGLIILLGGGLWAILPRPTYHLIIASASGETYALSSKEKQYISNIVSAISDALTKRDK